MVEIVPHNLKKFVALVIIIEILVAVLEREKGVKFIIYCEVIL